MNEVSFRDSVLDSIDAIVTESSNDVLFSLLDTADKAMMIMENCADTDDIWKYSIWQEADGNAEQIDKDKHPFKENSTLKTILMLPINLIKFIFKTISQAFSPQKAEESSKLAAVAEKGKNVAQKILPFFFTFEGELNLPVVIGTGIAGGSLTIDAIIRKNRSLVVKAVNAVINTWTKIIRRLKGMGVDSVPEKFEFTANKSNPEKFDVSLDFEKADAYIDAMKKLIDELSGKIDSIKNTTDEEKKEVAANDLRKELLAVTRTCPIYRGVKTYTSKEIADFYAKVTGKAKQLDQGEIDKFINAYQPIADGSTDKHTKAVATGISNTFAVFNAFLTAVSSIKTANDTINRVIVQASEYNEIPKADTAPNGFPNGYYMLDDTGKMVQATGDWNKDTAYFTKISDTPADNSQNAQVTTGGETPQAEETPKPEETSSEAQEPTEQKADETPANGEPTETPATDESSSTENNDNNAGATENPKADTDAVDQNGPKTLTAEDALSLIKSNNAYKDRNVYIENGVIKYNKMPFATKSTGLAVSVDGKERRLKVKVDNGKHIYVLEYAVEDEEPIDPVVAAWYNK